MPILTQSVDRTCADVLMPALFADHMVLQRDQANAMWGWAEPSGKVVVVFGGQTEVTRADTNGKWQVKLDPLPAGGPHNIVIEGDNESASKMCLSGKSGSARASPTWVGRSALPLT